MSVGKLIRFDDVRGYGFIAPTGGGEDVFVHANDFGELRHQVHAGMRVMYEVAESDRGLKVASVRVLDNPAPVAAPPPAAPPPAAPPPADLLPADLLPADLPQKAAVPRPRTASGDDDGMCDVLTAEELTAELTEMLLQHVPSLTGAQVTQLRARLVEHARSHGWAES